MLRTNYFQRAKTASRSRTSPSSSTGAHPRPARPAADVRDLRLLAPDGGRPSPRGQGRPRRDSLVRPARGLRTEILGLMKAQTVKNAVIVPTGAKGGFVLKRPPRTDALREEVVECYRILVRGLLDLTDTLVDGEVVPPPDVVRYDGDDLYSSSRPTRARRRSRTSPTRSRPSTASGWATPSPRAARRATTTRRWASRRAARGSRSSVISASSASTSTRPTSRWSGSATCRATCSATGCSSRHIKLLGAFDHRHVFVDPDPDPDQSFEERRGCSRCRARPGRTTTRS